MVLPFVHSSFRLCSIQKRRLLSLPASRPRPPSRSPLAAMPLTAEVLREHVIDSSAKLRDSFVRIDAQVRMQNNKMEEG